MIATAIAMDQATIDMTGTTTTTGTIVTIGAAIATGTAIDITVMRPTPHPTTTGAIGR